MKTRNAYRDKKISEIRGIYGLYPDLSLSERLFMVLDSQVRRAMSKDDYTELSSIGELARVFEHFFLNDKGKPNGDAINLMNKIISQLRKDKGHPHIRPFTEPHIEMDPYGNEVIRNYLNLLRGSKAVTYVNNRLEKQITGLKQSQRQNRELINVRKVLREAEQYREELEIKQQDANRKRGKRKQ